jgi:ArsR family transcriptional regulator
MTQKRTVERQLEALADATRLRIVNLLVQGELCGCDLGHVLHLSQPNISQHLAYLRHAGLVSNRREGYRVYYRLAEKRDRVLSGLLESLRLAFECDRIFVSDMQRLKKAIKDGTCATQPALRGRGASREARSGKATPTQAGGRGRSRRSGGTSTDGAALVAEPLPLNREPPTPSRLPGPEFGSLENAANLPSDE